VKNSRAKSSRSGSAWHADARGETIRATVPPFPYLRERIFFVHFLPEQECGIPYSAIHTPNISIAMENGTVLRKRILVVEDDEQSVQYINVLLQKIWDVTAASWADDAWDILEREHIDLVLMDLSLPGEESGLDLTLKIRNSPEFSDLPIIAVTAHAFHADRMRCMEAGCNDYLSKPFERMDLLRAIEALI
jgi:CheY-like chemotaxis protein